MSASHVVLNGGLGNQLWQLAFAHKLAESGPVVVTQISNKHELNSHLENGAEIISDLISLCSHGISFRKYDFANPFVRGKFIPESNWSRLLPMKRIDSRSRNWRNFHEIETSGQHVHLGFYQSLGYLRTQVSTVLYETQTLLSHSQNIIPRASNEDYAVIHLRGGDYYQDRHKNSFGVLDENYYSKLALEIIKRGFKSAYVVTDDEQKVKDRLKNIHQLELRPLTSINEITTINAMNNAKIMGLANSSFSWWGGMLSKSNGGIMLSPFPWFKYQIESSDLSDLYETDTVKIPSSFLS